MVLSNAGVCLAVTEGFFSFVDIWLLNLLLAFLIPVT